MKRLALLLMCFANTLFSRGQDNNFNRAPIALPSPDAAQFIRYGDVPVSYSTGVPGISIPIYRVTCGHLSLPIDLSYHASGIKVMDVAGTAGLGWSLNVGGLVSRTILGLDDQQNRPKAFLSASDFDAQRVQCGNALSYSCVQTLVQAFSDAFSQQKETVSDRYFYSFNGRTGIFRPEFQTGVIKTIPYSALKISAGVNNAGPYKITDEDGTNYYFEQAEFSGSFPGGSAGNMSYYLTKIESSDLTHAINVHYKQDDPVSQFVKTYALIHTVETTTDVHQTKTYQTLVQDNEFVNSSTPEMPDSITSDNETLQFQYIADRPDLRKSRLYRIVVLNRITRDTIKIIEFQHSYFGTASDNNQRLRLDNLYFKDNAGATVQQYGFGYNNTALPPYYHSVGMSEHHNVDYWGYYNGADASGLIPREFLDPANFASAEIALYGGDRRPNPATAQACMLTEITYPTGGKTDFEYELNKVFGGYSYSFSPPDGDDFGGLRVKKITSTAGATSQPVIKTYKYAGWFHTIVEPELYVYDKSSLHWLNLLVFNTVETSTAATDAFMSMTTGGDVPVLYDDVIEYDGTETDNNGYVEYFYDDSNIPYQVYDPGTNGNPHDNGSYLIDFGNYQPQLKAKVFHGKDQANKDKEVKREDYMYANFNSGSFITGVKLIRNTPFSKSGDAAGFTDADVVCYGSNGVCVAGLSALLSYHEAMNTTGILDVPLLTQKKETIHPSTGTGDLVTTTAYTYDLVTLQPIEEDAINSKGENIISVKKYPADFSSADPYNTMVTRNILTPLVEQLTYKNTINSQNFLQSNKTNYDFWDGSSWSPSATNIIESRTVDTRSKDQAGYETRLRYYSYDNRANLTTVAKENDSYQGYQWGYNQMYPTAHIVNATKNEFYFQSYEESVQTGVTGGDAHTGKKFTTSPVVIWSAPNSRSYVISYWYRNNNVWKYSGELNYTPLHGSGVYQMAGGDAYDDVRVYPSDAQLTTYTYEPSVGMTSQMDARGVTTYYEYDGFGRLKIIRDNDRNILKKYCYNYAGQPEACPVMTGSAAKSGSFTPNNCSTGYLPTTSVTYTVPAGSYFGVTQAAADALAQADVNANGQAYANQHGVCVPGVPNDARSVTFTRNNCYTGQQGEQYTFTVAAGQYYGPSKTAANQLADAYIAANGQAYTNTHVYCLIPNPAIDANFYSQNCPSGQSAQPYHVVIPAGRYFDRTDGVAYNMAMADAQAQANASGGCAPGLPTVYARFEIGLTYPDLQEYGLYITFWSDAQMSTPANVPDGLSINVYESGYDELWINGSLNFHNPYSDNITQWGFVYPSSIMLDDIYFYDGEDDSNDGNGNVYVEKWKYDYTLQTISSPYVNIIMLPPSVPPHPPGF